MDHETAVAAQQRVLRLQKEAGFENRPKHDDRPGAVLAGKKKAPESAFFIQAAKVLLTWCGFCHEDFNTAVLGTALYAAVVGNRLALTATVGGNALPRHATADQVVSGCIGAIH